MHFFFNYQQQDNKRNYYNKKSLSLNRDKMIIMGVYFLKYNNKSITINVLSTLISSTHLDIEFHS